MLTSEGSRNDTFSSVHKSIDPTPSLCSWSSVSAPTKYQARCVLDVGLLWVTSKIRSVDIPLTFLLTWHHKDDDYTLLSIRQQTNVIVSTAMGPGADPSEYYRRRADTVSIFRYHQIDSGNRIH